MTDKNVPRTIELSGLSVYRRDDGSIEIETTDGRTVYLDSAHATALGLWLIRATDYSPIPQPIYPWSKK